jgi:superfamily II DNA or RNA helicase
MDWKKDKIDYLLQHIKIILSKHGSVKKSIDDIDSLFHTSAGESVPIEVTNYLKGIVQNEATQAWINNNHKGMICLATGVGKSKIVVDWLFSEGSATETYMIVVPTEKLRDKGWKDEFDKWDETQFQRIYEEVRKECYASIASKFANKTFHLVVLDEGHNITEANSLFFKHNNVEKILALSATPPKDPIKKELLKKLGLPIVYELSLDDAVKLRLVSPYEIIIVESNLNDSTKNISAGSGKKAFKVTEKVAYEKMNTYINNLQPKINEKPTTEVGYGYQDDNVKILTPSQEKNLNRIIMKRMKFIYGLQSKTEAAEYIKREIDRKDRTIYFCGTIQQAEKLCPYYYHSKTKDDALTLFINEHINELSCVKALNEGINISNVDNGVVVQIDSEERNLVQRLGRIIRYREGHLAKIVIIVAKGTVDEDWCNKAIRNLDTTKIRRIRLADLKVGNEKI